MRRNRRRRAHSSLPDVPRRPRMSKARLETSAAPAAEPVRHERALPEVRADRLAGLFKDMPFACVLLDHDQIVREANDAAHAMLDAGGGLRGVPFLNFLREDERPEFLEQLKLVRAHRTIADLELTVHGTEYGTPCLVHLFPAADGAPRSVWAMIFNPAEQHVHEEARYFELFNDAPVGYVLLDRNAVVLEINETAGRLLGVRPAATIGRPFILFVRPSDRTAFLDHIRRVRTQLASSEVELTLEARNGRQPAVHLSTKPASRFGRPESSWTAIVDLTEPLRLQEAQSRAERERLEARHEAAMARARGEAKDRFLAALSHELRTPLTPAFNATTLLANVTGLPREAARFVAMIRRNIELEVRLIDDLLDVTRIGRSKLQLERSDVDFHALLRDALRMATAEAEAKRLTVSQELNASRAIVNGDSIRLRQVIWNLVNNAVKFTPAGGSIVVRTANDETGALRLSVTDTGIGFASEAVARMFVAFEQEMSKGRSNRGLGLGLAISKGIVEAHGGQIWARSPGEGLGSTFEVELATVVAAASPALPISVTERRVADGPADHLRVLVVEDNPDSAETLASLLSLHGHSVETASRLEEGIQRSNEVWDVIITDIGLPDGSGLALAREVRSPEHLQRPRSLVALSGFGSPADIEASRDAGFDVHLTKPVDVSRILDIFAALPQR